LRRDDDLIVRQLRGLAAAIRVGDTASLRAHQLERVLGMQVQRGTVRDVDADDVLVDPGLDADDLGIAAPRADTHRRAHGSARRRCRGGFRALRLSRNDEGDLAR
jgi:hypothetical protein